MIRATLAGLALLACTGALAQDRAAPSVDPAAVALYQATHARLLERIRPGLRASVRIERPDGAIDGYDEYAIDDRVRLREVRGGHEDVAVGTTLCSRDGDGRFDCSGIDVPELGLRAVEDARVYRAEQSTAPCGPTSCRQVYIEEWADVPGEEASPAARSYYTLRLLVRDDGLPYSLDEARYQADEPVEPHAMFVFDYSAPVAPITVPDTAPAD